MRNNLYASEDYVLQALANLDIVFIIIVIISIQAWKANRSCTLGGWFELFFIGFS